MDDRGGVNEHGGYQRGDQGAAPPKGSQKTIGDGRGAHAGHSSCAWTTGDQIFSSQFECSCGQTVIGRMGERLANGQRPLRQSAKRASGEVSLYSGIQTPKKLKPNWLN